MERSERKLFFAIEIPTNVKGELFGLESEFQLPPAKWVEEKDWHVTVLFLGPVVAAARAAVMEAGQRIAEATEPFWFTLKEAILAPEGGNKRMVWAVFEPITAFNQLVSRTEKELSGIVVSEDGFKNNKTPHITLCRFDGQVDEEKAFKLQGKFLVEEIKLLESVPIVTGREYLEIGRFNLDEKNRFKR